MADESNALAGTEPIDFNNNRGRFTIDPNANIIEGSIESTYFRNDADDNNLFAYVVFGPDGNPRDMVVVDPATLVEGERRIAVLNEKVLEGATGYAPVLLNDNGNVNPGVFNPGDVVPIVRNEGELGGWAPVNPATGQPVLGRKNTGLIFEDSSLNSLDPNGQVGDSLVSSENVGQGRIKFSFEDRPDLRDDYNDLIVEVGGLQTTITEAFRERQIEQRIPASRPVELRREWEETEVAREETPNPFDPGSARPGYGDYDEDNNPIIRDSNTVFRAGTAGIEASRGWVLKPGQYEPELTVSDGPREANSLALEGGKYLIPNGTRDLEFNFAGREVEADFTNTPFAVVTGTNANGERVSTAQIISSGLNAETVAVQLGNEMFDGLTDAELTFGHIPDGGNTQPNLQAGDRFAVRPSIANGELGGQALFDGDRELIGSDRSVSAVFVDPALNPGGKSYGQITQTTEADIIAMEDVVSRVGKLGSDNDYNIPGKEDVVFTVNGTNYLSEPLVTVTPNLGRITDVGITANLDSSLNSANLGGWISNGSSPFIVNDEGQIVPKNSGFTVGLEGGIAAATTDIRATTTSRQYEGVTEGVQPQVITGITSERVRDRINTRTGEVISSELVSSENTLSDPVDVGAPIYEEEVLRQTGERTSVVEGERINLGFYLRAYAEGRIGKEEMLREVGDLYATAGVEGIVTTLPGREAALNIYAEAGGKIADLGSNYDLSAVVRATQSLINEGGLDVAGAIEIGKPGPRSQPITPADEAIRDAVRTFQEEGGVIQGISGQGVNASEAFVPSAAPASTQVPNRSAAIQ